MFTPTATCERQAGPRRCDRVAKGVATLPGGREDGLTEVADMPSGLTIRRSRPVLERSQETRRALIHTATRLWSERGFDRVTVADICAAAGLGRTTFYLHFESKEQLLRSLAGATASGVAADLDAVGQTATLDERLEVFVSGVVRRMTAVPKALTQLVIHSWRVLPTRAQAEGAVEATRFADLLRQLLTEARDRGEVIASADTNELGEILGALTMDAIESWASGQSGDRPLEAVLRFRIDLVVAQFRTGRRPTPARAGDASGDGIPA